ncbi:hypothetical protein [Paenibacillus urinalis]|uniref:Uncharacterized protein n=1 Tax=Paenibacillus urinalis TaxID=521520 RepID=A0AAX3N144_9BACL|nr:hypothetical protein [Paenibacillus urinalis]WDH83426.1 hypothetical protein PUW23_04050 [Paenibacillus urinalis]
MKSAADFLLLDSGASFSQQNVRDGDLDVRVMVLDQYDLEDYDLPQKGHKFLIIDEFIDQELMLRHRGKIKSFLDQGNILLFCGHLLRHWIPGASMFVPKTIHNHLDYTVTVLPHPIFEGVLSDDITYNKGVAGFFARGHHPFQKEQRYCSHCRRVSPLLISTGIAAKALLLFMPVVTCSVIDIWDIAVREESESSWNGSSMRNTKQFSTGGIVHAQNSRSLHGQLTSASDFYRAQI